MVSGASSVWARTVTFTAPGGAPQFTLGAQFVAQGSGTGVHPDVGGDPNPSPSLPGNYCVTWANGGSLYYNIVRTDGTRLFTSGALVPTWPGFISNPSISKSSGVGAASTQQWIIVWQQTYGPNDEDIYSSIIGSTGAIVVPVLPVSLSTLSESNPQVSSKTDFLDGSEKWMAVYQRYIPGSFIMTAHTDIFGSLFSGTLQLSYPVDLTSLLNRPPIRDQINPCVDTDGTRFVIGFSEDPSQFTPDVVPYLATVHIVGGTTLAVTSYPVPTNAYAGPDDHVQITSQRSGGAFTTNYMSVWDVASITNSDMDVLGALYGGYTNLPPSVYFNHALPGCGSITITASGLPALGETFFLDLTGAQALPFLLLGTPVAPIPLCSGCDLGVDPASLIALFTTSYALTVPQDTTLIGQTFAAQGLDFLASGGCVVPADFTLSDAIIITIL